MNSYVFEMFNLSKILKIEDKSNPPQDITFTSQLGKLIKSGQSAVG